MPTLYLFIGYPGAGKTTTALKLAEATGAEHVWADRERRRMFGNPSHSFEESRQLYDVLNKQAESLLKSGKSVIFDTNFNYRADREHLRAIADSAGADTKTIWITTPREIAYHRAVHDSEGRETRQFGNMSESEFNTMADRLEPPDESEKVIKLDGSQLDISELLKQLA